ncbi:MAG: histidine kinase dimerization/phosphoacceptor domain -containing protein [Ignavibacteria bacterium]
MTGENPKTILLVEDRTITAISGRMTLEKLGYNVVTVNTGEKAIEICKTNNFINLILMDIYLGAGLDGIETAIEILKEHVIPIVFLSGRIEPEIAEKIGKITSYGYVKKRSGKSALNASIKIAFKLFETHEKLKNELAEQKLAKEEFYRNEKIWQEAQQLARVGIWRWTVATDKIEWSKELFNITGLDPNLPAPSFTEMSSVYTPESWQLLSEAVEKTLRFEKPYELELEMVRPDKNHRHTFTYGTVDYDADGMVTGLHGIVQDVTESKLTTLNFNKKLTIIASRIRGHLAYVNANTLHYEFVNEVFEKSFGIPVNKIIGSHIKDIIGEKNYQFALKYINEVKAGKTVSYENTFILESRPRWVEVNYSPIINADGEITSIAVLSFDITEHKLAEEKIKNLLAEKELILIEVHHRIRNNMNTITSLLSLQSGTLEDPVAIEALEDAASRIRSVMVLYNKLYQFAGYTAMSVLDYLPSLIDEIMADFSNSTSVQTEKKIDDFVLSARKLQPLGIIINEILTNIIKHAFTDKPDGLIVISAFLNGNIASIVVQNNGNSMPESVDFDNPDNFGMALVGILTEQLEGSIRIERENGTRVVLEFPV